MMTYKIKRKDRAAGSVEVGDICHRGGHDYGCCSDDEQVTGLPHIALSHSPTGTPFFTIPREDVEEVA